MLMDFLGAVLSGGIFVLGVIAGIGPQNLNTMTHGIRRNHEFAVATTCFLADSILIVVGILGLKLTDSRVLILLINIVGIAFLAYYLWIKLRGLNQRHEHKLKNEIVSRKVAVFRALALTWLNPLVIIDTIVVIGGASAHYAGWRNWAFLVGAVLGDFVWLFGLVIISRTFAERLNRPRVWLFIDISTILLVAYVLIKMLSFFFN